MNQSAAVRVLDEIPSEEDIEDYAYESLEEFDAESATATIELLDHPPEWMSVGEQDQINAYLRDGSVCVLVIYMRETDDAELDDE